eukprot:TRINITY_DN2302_c0_g1_i1.p2 TRINITY_DN2302_c0_g1~~TRINITY_DN2302_c0_g1_i1.p2  ORF type:complete len:362 (-),score=46.37 TRINITY_DN2302_c0_g1_i1:3221-4306(-)
MSFWRASALRGLRRASTFAASTPAALCRSSIAHESGKAERRPVQWQHPDYYKEEKLEEEMRRVLDVCHGCRACFDLCDSFPTLFKMVDETTAGEVSAVPSSSFKDVVDQCTLCDMCFSVTCPYVPPHPLEIDFPHLMLRYRAVEQAKASGSAPTNHEAAAEPFHWPHEHEAAEVDEGVSRTLAFDKPSALKQALLDTDRVGALASRVAPVANWALARERGTDKPRPVRKVIESVTDLSAVADLPSYVSPSEQLVNSNLDGVKVNTNAPAYASRPKVIIYATCLGNYNKPSLGLELNLSLRYPGDIPVWFCRKGNVRWKTLCQTQMMATASRLLLLSMKTMSAKMPSLALVTTSGHGLIHGE